MKKTSRSLYQNSFLHRACKGWNSLPTELHGKLDKKDRKIDKQKFKMKIMELVKQNRIDKE